MKILIFCFYILTCFNSFAQVEACKDTSNIKENLSCYQTPSTTPFNEAIKEAKLLPEEINKWSFIYQNVTKLKKLRDHELEKYKHLYRSITFDYNQTPEHKNTHDLQFNEIFNDFNLLLETTRELHVTQTQINILSAQKIAHIAFDLEDKKKELEKIKMAIFLKNRILAGNEIDKLIKASIENESRPNIDQFKKSFIPDCSNYLVKQRETIDMYDGFLSNLNESAKKGLNTIDAQLLKKPQILEDIFSSGLGEMDFLNPVLKKASCQYFEQFENYKRNQKIKDLMIDTSLIIGPFLLGGAGPIARALSMSKLLRFGSPLSSPYNQILSRSAQFTLTGTILAHDLSSLKEKDLECERKFTNLSINASAKEISEIKNCKEELSQLIIFTSVGLGTAGLVQTTSKISPYLKELIVKNAKEKNSGGFIDAMLKDFGAGKNQYIKEEISLIKERVKNQESSLALLSNKPNLKRQDVADYLKTHPTKDSIPDFKSIPSTELNSYTEKVAKDSIELLYIPGADIPHLPKAVNRVGHIAIRIGDKVYHQTGGSGFKIENFADFINKTKKDYKVYGQVLESSPKERAIMEEYFNMMKEKQLPYSFLQNNCAQSVCRALDLAKINKYNAGTALDPILTTAKIKRSDRVVMKTVYNEEKDLSHSQMKILTTSNRALFYGLPTTTLAGSMYESYQMVDWLINFLDDNAKTK